MCIQCGVCMYSVCVYSMCVYLVRVFVHSVWCVCVCVQCVWRSVCIPCVCVCVLPESPHVYTQPSFSSSPDRCSKQLFNNTPSPSPQSPPPPPALNPFGGDLVVALGSEDDPFPSPSPCPATTRPLTPRGVTVTVLTECRSLLSTPRICLCVPHPCG